MKNATPSGTVGNGQGLSQTVMGIRECYSWRFRCKNVAFWIAVSHKVYIQISSLLICRSRLRPSNWVFSLKSFWVSLLCHMHVSDAYKYNIAFDYTMLLFLNFRYSVSAGRSCVQSERWHSHVKSSICFRAHSNRHVPSNLQLLITEIWQLSMIAVSVRRVVASHLRRYQWRFFNNMYILSPNKI